MARYFTVMTGLRGCYMPDAVVVIRCETRRDLKEYIQAEAAHQREGGAFGLTKDRIAWAANHAWKKASGGAVLPFATQRGQHPTYSIEIAVSTRKDYLENNEGNN